ncbi:hypothetical protein N9M89_02735 [Amylibacter sp.]|jgi:hypothetical protein|nr:hypothetical protein [Amylibacter sp.]
MNNPNKPKNIPVAITFYNRFDRLEACLNSLAACHGSNQTDILVFLDIGNSKHGENDIKNTENITQAFTEFSSLNILASKSNLGASQNAQRILYYMSTNYESFICLEDDVVCDQNFLDIMKGLMNIAQDDDRISSVGAFSPDMQSSNQNFYLSKYFNGYGVGFWSNSTLIKYLLECHNPYNDLAKAKMENKVLQYHLTLPSLLKKINKNNKLNDIQATYFNIINDQYQIRPTTSLTTNTGFDGLGINSGYRDNMPVFIADNALDKVDPLEVFCLVYDKLLDEKFYRFFREPVKFRARFRHKISTIIKSFIR